MAQSIVAHEHPIAKVLSEDYAFRIPEYQRPYAWTTEQAGDLIEDLLGFMQANAGRVDEMPTYFLGSIVLIKGDAPDAAVVDGQQRLTTLTLLLSAIRANVPQAEAEDLTAFIYEKGNSIKGTSDRFRLAIRERDSEFFRNFVQLESGFETLIGHSGELKDSQLRLRENAILFNQRLNQLPVGERVALAQFIVTRCFLVVVSTPDENSAYRIFSVLNSRGLDLSATDILKARLIGSISQALRDQYTLKWEDTEETLGRDNFGDLFAHIRTIYRKTKAKETLLKEMDQYVPELKRPTAFIDEVLIPCADAYSEIVQSSYTSSDNASSVNECLRWLNRLEFADWIPPAIAFSVRHRNSAVAMTKFFELLERLAFFMVVTRMGVNDRIDRFGAVTAAAEKGLPLDSSALALTAFEQDEFYRALEGPIYEALPAKARSLLLLRLDSLLSGGGATYEYDVVTVEHVLPQFPSPGTHWIKMFPDATERRRLTHVLGNLVLLTRRKNSSASNYEFEKKKDAYFKKGGVSPFVITTQVLNSTEWSPEQIKSRQSACLRQLEAHWKLFDRKRIEITVAELA